MTDLVFVDTNVLVYERDAGAPDKQSLAHVWMETLWRTRVGRVSGQVLSEFYSVVTRKLRPGLPPGEARTAVLALGAWSPVPVDGPLLERAFAIEDAHRLSWWDALIVAAAAAAGCRFLLSEDLQDGAQLAGVRVVNPFTTEPSAIVKADR